MRRDMLTELNALPDQVVDAERLGDAIEVGRVERVVVAGMGGSGSAGHVLKAVLPTCPVPIEVAQGFSLPPWVGKQTLVFVVSYSGETEESLEMFADACRRQAMVVVITNGGRLLSLAQGKDKSYLKLPGRLLPRNALVSSLMGMLNVLRSAGLGKDVPDVYQLAKVLRHEAWQDKAKELAGKLLGKVPLVYVSPSLEGIGLRTKQMLNENAKSHAFTNVIPEVGHNEIEGFSQMHARFHVLMIQDEDDPPKVKQRFASAKKLIERQGVPVTAIRLKGPSRLARVLSAVHLGNLTSHYLAELTDVDSAETKLIDELKGSL